MGRPPPPRSLAGLIAGGQRARVLSNWSTAVPVHLVRRRAAGAGSLLWVLPPLPLLGAPGVPKAPGAPGAASAAAAVGTGNYECPHYCHSKMGKCWKGTHMKKIQRGDGTTGTLCPVAHSEDIKKAVLAGRKTDGAREHVLTYIVHR